ncbi:MAG: hypothetical protein PVH88_03085 [Ignavibacteria bacterium]|jgi:ribosome maturation factor RimP
MKKIEIEKKFKEIISKQNCLLIDIVFRGDNNNRIIEVFIDNSDGITTDLCADISRDLNKLIETEELITSRYRLDVSSPGVDRPLKFIEQFQKHVNRNFEIDYQIKDEKKKFTGRLIKIENGLLNFDVKGIETALKYEDILNAKVKISF